MPTYEYRCPDGHTFERRAKMSEAASELECPTCGKIATRQLSGGAGLVFKGSGFYLTDYGKNAHRGTAPDAANGARKSRESSDGEGAASSRMSRVIVDAGIERKWGSSACRPECLGLSTLAIARLCAVPATLTVRR